jgi:hypothetical protein
MYFGRVMLENVPGVQWEQSLKNKKDAYYGQPVLVGFRGGAMLNPVWIMVTAAYNISHKKPARLRELYEAWVKLRT